MIFGPKIAKFHSESTNSRLWLQISLQIAKIILVETSDSNCSGWVGLAFLCPFSWVYQLSVFLWKPVFCCDDAGWCENLVPMTPKCTESDVGIINLWFQAKMGLIGSLISVFSTKYGLLEFILRLCPKHTYSTFARHCISWLFLGW